MAASPPTSPASRSQPWLLCRARSRAPRSQAYPGERRMQRAVLVCYAASRFYKQALCAFTDTRAIGMPWYVPLRAHRHPGHGHALPASTLTKHLYADPDAGALFPHSPHSHSPHSHSPHSHSPHSHTCPYSCATPFRA
eukprot:353793-Chlamydomonas_euryale.AAC.2